DLLAHRRERAPLQDLLAVRVLDREHFALEEGPERRADLEELFGDVQERHAGWSSSARKLLIGRIAQGARDRSPNPARPRAGRARPRNSSSSVIGAKVDGSASRLRYRSHASTKSTLPCGWTTT